MWIVGVSSSLFFFQIFFSASWKQNKVTKEKPDDWSQNDTIIFNAMPQKIINFKINYSSSQPLFIRKGSEVIDKWVHFSAGCWKQAATPTDAWNPNCKTRTIEVHKYCNKNQSFCIFNKTIFALSLASRGESLFHFSYFSSRFPAFPA